MIYFIQAETTFHVKIGYSSRAPEDRLASLQVANPTGLHLLKAIPGDRLLEADLHRQFSEYHFRGEWFHPGPKLIRFMLECAAWDQPANTVKPDSPKKEFTGAAQQDVIRVLIDRGAVGMSVSDIAQATGCIKDTVRKVLARMRRSSAVTKRGRFWIWSRPAITEETDEASDPPHSL